MLTLAACGDDAGDSEGARPPGAEAADGDGGTSFELEGQPVEEFMHIHGLAIAPWSPDDVWVSTHQGLMVIDAEGEWTYASDDPHDFMGFNVNPTEDDVLYTSGHPAPQSSLENPLGFMVSDDAGLTWDQRSLYTEVDFHALAVHEADGDVIYGFDATGGRMLHSENGGLDWDERTLPHPEGVAALAVHPEDPETLLAGTPESLMVSTDSGESWEDLSTGAVTGVAYDPGEPDRIVAFEAEGDGLVESADGGDSWEPLGLEIDGDDAVLHVAIHPTDRNIIYVGTAGESLYRTLDGGQEWEQLASHGAPEGEEDT